MSTIYGWDTSSHDDTPASRDGIDFFTCKLTDGDHYYENPTFAAKMNAMHGFGVEVMGAYHVLWGNRSIANQVDWFVQRLDATIPWWRDFDYFICQSDDEPFYSGLQTAPSVSQINEFHDRIITATNGKISAPRNSAYAPGWYYGNSVTGLKYNWWQSNYGGNPVGHYPDIYPGNASSRWAGPIATFFLQYGSNAIIAGQTTSDANAYRGTLDQLKAALGGTDVTVADVIVGESQLWDQAAQRSTPTGRNFANDVYAVISAAIADEFANVNTQLAAMQTELDAIKASIGTGGSSTTTPVIYTINGTPWTATATPETPAP